MVPLLHRWRRGGSQICSRSATASSCAEEGSDGREWRSRAAHYPRDCPDGVWPKAAWLDWGRQWDKAFVHSAKACMGPGTDSSTAGITAIGALGQRIKQDIVYATESGPLPDALFATGNGIEWGTPVLSPHAGWEDLRDRPSTAAHASGRAQHRY